VQPKELAKKIRSSRPPCIFDVRSGFEFRSGHIPGAAHAPSWKIMLRLVSLPKDRQELLVLTCEHGPRAQMAKSLLSMRGYGNIALLEGHMSGWRRAGLPMER
jgi:rhodanese-related sulfurtransferase